MLSQFSLGSPKFIKSVYKSSECMPGLVGEFSLCGLIGRQEVTKNNAGKTGGNWK